MVHVLPGAAVPVRGDVHPSKAANQGADQHHTPAVPNPDRATTNPDIPVTDTHRAVPNHTHRAVPDGVHHPGAVPNSHRIRHPGTHPNGVVPLSLS
jgi:hypothetical protein